MTDHYEAILRAWNYPGYQPAYHRAMQEELRTRWPMLARALDYASVDDAVKIANGDKPWTRTFHGPNAAGVYTSDDGLTITQAQVEHLLQNQAPPAMRGPEPKVVFRDEPMMTGEQAAALFKEPGTLIEPLGMSKPINEGFDYSDAEPFTVTRGPGINGSLDYSDVPPVSEGNIRRSPEGKE